MVVLWLHGLSVCGSAMFSGVPSLVTTVVLRGVEVLIVPIYWDPSTRIGMIVGIVVVAVVVVVWWVVWSSIVVVWSISWYIVGRTSGVRWNLLFSLC